MPVGLLRARQFAACRSRGSGSASARRSAEGVSRFLLPGRVNNYTDDAAHAAFCRHRHSSLVSLLALLDSHFPSVRRSFHTDMDILAVLKFFAFRCDETAVSMPKAGRLCSCFATFNERSRQRSRNADISRGVICLMPLTNDTRGLS